MNIAIITAAGRGQRVGGKIKKQFIPLCGKPVLTHTIERFLNNSLISAIIVVLPEEDIDNYTLPENTSKLILKTAGGEHRADSVYNGLKTAEKVFNDRCTGMEERIVLIHDGVRPFVSDSLIAEVIKAAEKTGAVIPVLSITDTIIKSNKKGAIIGYPERSDRYLVQTPQAYRFSIIMDAYALMGKQASKAGDESWLVFKSGYAISIIPGEKGNMKITDPEDLFLAESYMEKGE